MRNSLLKKINLKRSGLKHFSLEHLNLKYFNLKHFKPKRLQPRRPLAAAALAFAAAVRILTLLHPLPLPAPDREDGEWAQYAGTVADLDCYTDTADGERKRLVYVQAAAAADAKGREGGGEGIGLICRLSEESLLPHIGSRIRIQGRIRHFRQASNPGEFDAAGYYGRQGYACELTQAVITGESREYSRFRHGLYRLKEHMIQALELLLPAREASAVKAMLLGEKKGMDRELKELYQNTGISHILAISGLHVSILGMGVYGFLSRFLGKRLSCMGAGFFLFSFLCMTGFSASSMRAGIMSAFLLTARLIGRTYDTATALSVAAALLLVENPAFLEDSGFLLSFSAAFGAAVLLPAFEKMKPLWRVPSGSDTGWEGWIYRLCGRLSDSFRASFCISLAALPPMLGSFYEWNLLSVPVNLAVIPLMGILMGGCILLAAVGGLLLLFGAQWLVLLRPVVWLVRGILMFYELLCRLAGGGAAGRMRTGAPELWQLLFFYGLLLLLIVLAHKLPRPVGMCAGAALCLIFCLNPFQRTQVTMLDVGQGDCIHIRTAQGHHYLCDGGSTSQKDTGTWQVIPYLKHQGVNRLELIFVSHWDEDHINALTRILEWAGEGGIRVGGLVLSADGPVDEAFAGLCQTAGEAGVPVYRMAAGERITDGSVSFYALYPARPLPGQEAQNRNNASLTMRFAVSEKGKERFSMLFTGDIEAEGEEVLLRSAPPDALASTILKTAHHGSDSSTTQPFLDAVRPRAALISAGREPSYGHPSREVLERLEAGGIPCFVTARTGAITVTLRREDVSVETFLKVD